MMYTRTAAVAVAVAVAVTVAVAVAFDGRIWGVQVRRAGEDGHVNGEFDEELWLESSFSVSGSLPQRASCWLQTCTSLVLELRQTSGTWRDCWGFDPGSVGKRTQERVRAVVTSYCTSNRSRMRR